MRQQINLTALKRESLNFVHFLAAAKPAYKYTFAALFAGFLLGLLGPTYDLLVMRVSDVFSFRLWRIITCILVEPNIFLFIWSLVAVINYSPTFCRFGPDRNCQIRCYYTATNNTHNFCPWFTLICLFSSLKFFLLRATVLARHCGPDNPYGRLKNGHLPLTALFFTSIFWLFSLVRLTAPLQVLLGLQISWTYLRFFQSLPGSDNVGDDSEHFTWTSLFPRRVQPLTTLIAKAVFPVLVGLRLCKKLKDVDALNAFETLQSSLPESRDAERKRQKALRVLNERLNLATASQDKSMQPTGLGSVQPSPLLEPEVEMDELVDVNVVNSPENNSTNQLA
uniref:Transmembrane protein n=1 Tax=Ditylenchus dipsaci TaxID=166011 RepID=A0A915D1T6_9BILA